MKRKDLIDSVVNNFDLKRDESKKIVDHILTQLLESGLSGEGFGSPILRVTSRDVEEKIVETPEGNKIVPAKRVMRLVKSKSYVSSANL